MMEEMDDLDVESVSSDYSILPEAHEMDGVAQPYLATRPDANSSISSHTQVEFVNMCSSYPSSQDLVLCYTFTAEHMPSVTDRLALYKVGFTTPQDYLVYEWAPMQPQAAPSSDAADGRIFCVTFSKSGLPGDANEFYQVCYLSEDRLIRGVSAPFQLVQDGSAQSSLSSGAVSSIEQPDGTVLVTTDVSCLHTNINMLQACVQRVQAEKVAVEEQLAAVQLQLQGKTEQLRDLQLKIQDLSVAADKQQQASAAALLEAESRLSSLQQERDALQESLQAAQDEVDRLQEEIKLQVRHNDDVLKTLSQREENLAEKTAELHEKQEQLATAMNQLQALEAKQELLSSEMQKIVQERDAAQVALAEYTDASSRDQSHLNHVQNQLLTANEELRQQMEEQQEQKLLLEKTRDELQQTKQELEEEQSKLVSVQTSLDTCREELRVATERQKVLNADNKVLQDSVRSHLRYSAQLKLKLREAEGACAGAERVARQLSEQHQQAVQQRSKAEDRSNKLLVKCNALSKLILDQNMAESMEALLNLHDSDSVDDEEDNEARVDVVEVPPTITVATQGSACDAASVAASDLPVNQEKIAENITGSAEEKGNKGQEVEVERCDPSGASSESRIETQHISSVSEVSIQDAGPSCGNESEGKIESSIEQAKNVNAQPKEMSKPEEAANGSLANSKDVSGNASEDNNSMPKKLPDATQKKRSSDSQGPSQDTAHNHGPFGFNFQHQWHPFMAAGPQPPLFNPPPPHPHPPPFYGPVFTSGQTAPVFFPPSMPYHSASDLRRSFPGPNNSPDMPNSQPIPMPYPPLFPMPPLSFPFMPTPPPPPPPPQADSAPTEEDGLPPPLVPNPTESSLHAALLSTIGAAAQMASSAKIVSDQISGAFNGSATGAGDAHAQQSASNSSSEEQGNAGPNSQEQTAGNEQRQNNQSSSNGQWQFQHGPNKNGGYGCSFSNGPEGMRGHFSAHHNVHRAGACHSHRRHAPNAPGNPGRPPFCGRFHDRFRPQGWPFERDFLRPGFRQNVRLGRMSASNAGRTHMFDENLDEDFFRDVPRNAAAENSDSNNEDDGEEIPPTGGNATKPETFSGFAGNTNGTSTTTTTDATSGTTEHVHVNINLSSATAASESAGATRAETEHESVHSFGATANATPGTPASAPTVEEIYDGHLYCPLCPYTLDARSGALFDEHIDSHLEYICPVCSTAFQRSKQAEYEAHVNDHFSEEEAATAAGNAQNSSGPWGHFSWSRMDFD